MLKERNINQAKNSFDLLNTTSHEEMWDLIDAKADTEEQWLDEQASYLRSQMVGRDDRLGRIGVGVQYVVYGLPNNRVFKVAQTDNSALNEHRRQGGSDNLVEEILRLREDSVGYVQKLISSYPEASPLFGNPIFNGEKGIAGAYEQDKLTFFGGDGFNSLQKDEQIKYARNYIDLIKLMWTYGFSDRTMNFQVNAGLNNEGEIVLADFGEIDLSKDDLIRVVENHDWEKSWGVNILRKYVKPIVIDMFESNLTKDALDELWAVNLK